MKNLKTIILAISILVVFIIVNAFTFNTKHKVDRYENNHMINMFVTHGHCNTPFTGQVSNLSLGLTSRTDLGNPLEDMKISFDIDPSTFITCTQINISQKIKDFGLFYNKKNEKILFKTTNTYTVGLNWYQINGIMTIKGIENKVIFFATGIREPNDTWPTSLVLEGQLNLFDWGIDFDKIVFGARKVGSKQMHFNMTIPIEQ